MKFLSFILFLGLSISMYAQVCKDFSDTNSLENLEWFGNLNSFQISNSSAIPADMKPALQLNADTLNTLSYLAAPLLLETTDTLVWEFWLKMSFTPSPNNFARYYLTSNQEDLTKVSEGFFISFGESSKILKLFKQKQDSIFPLITGLPISKSTNVIRVKVKRDNTGLWQLWTDTLGNKNYTWQGSFIDSEVPTFNYSGIYCKYTKSNAAKMYFDDICIYPVLKDTIKPFVEKATLEMPNKVHIRFSEEVEAIAAVSTRNYQVDNGIGEALQAEIHGTEVILYFNPFQPEVNYTITISNIFDMQGNSMEKQTLSFIDYQIRPLDIIINEVLFHPKSGGVDFVEIYNRSKYDLSLAPIYLATIDKSAEVIKSMSSITNSVVIKSNDYVVLTTNTENIQTEYNVKNPEKMIKMKILPSFSNAEGVVVLATKDSMIIDKFYYSEKMHFPLLKEKAGISLERRNPDKPTNDLSNWQSAAESAGWATPTYKNSQYNSFLYLQEPFSVFPQVFSPDNDGIDDVLNISYNLNIENCVANISIFDSKGRMVKYLQKNTLLGQEGTFVWNGLTEQNRKAPMGMYIVFIEVFTTAGNVKQYKKVATLSTKR